ncbi:MAG: amidohydrolase [Flavobacteriales bacterium]|nr:amidohydrolase [Flavobacteriales bacterium]
MKRFYLFIPLLSLFMSSCYYTEEADILIHNASIYTVDDNFTITEAMAIKDGKIIDVGPNNELKNRYNAKVEIDAKMRPIYPGFIDAHCHFLWYGNTFFEVDLVGTKSWDEVIEKTIAFSKTNTDMWIKGRGWDQNDWEVKEFPTKAKLDRLFPDRAVLLRRIDGHAAIANQKALDLAGITIDTKIDGGIYKQIESKLTGLLIDNAIDTVQKAVPKLSQEQMKRALLKAQEMCFAKGLTTVDDAMLENEMVHTIDELQKSGELKMKVYGMLMPTEENKKEFLSKGPYLTEMLSIRSFKYFADGALGSRGAKLIEPYADDIHNTGLFLNDSTYFAKEAEALYKNGFQMNTHCIGDAANRMMLNIYGNTLKTTNDKRWRIEHCQVVNANDLEKFKTYTIIPSIQPTHATSDMYWAEDRLGEDRVKTAYAYKDLLKQNGIVALGTDFPIEDIDPLKTFYAAVVRKDKENFPTDGYQKENALTREETLRGITIWAAISNFEEEQKGSIEVGKAADFIILNQDIMKIPEANILETKVISTYVNGELVFKSK